MWIWVGLAVGWVWLRHRAGKPILPDLGIMNPFGRHDPFKQGAVLVKTESGHVAAVPADTVAIHPTVAATQGLLSPAATMAIATVYRAVQSPPLLDPSTGDTSIHAPRYLASGAWQMFGAPHAGLDYRLDEFGLPRSNSLASKPWPSR